LEKAKIKMKKIQYFFAVSFMSVGLMEMSLASTCPDQVTDILRNYYTNPTTAHYSTETKKIKCAYTKRNSREVAGPLYYEPEGKYQKPSNINWKSDSNVSMICSMINITDCPFEEER
jgi:hypothetical protein